MQRENIKLTEPKKTLIALVDADGCFYNQIVDVTLRHLIAYYGNLMDEIIYNPDVLNDHPEFIDTMRQSIVAYADHFGSQLAKEGKLHVRSDLTQLILKHRVHHEEGSDENRKVSDIKRYFIDGMNDVPQLKELYKDILLLANESLFVHLETRVKAESHNQLLLMSGSNRQSRNRELVNMINNGTALFVTDLCEMVSLLHDSLNYAGLSSATCDFDPFLLADIYAGQRDGHSFDLMLQEMISTTDEFFNHHDYVFDETKFTLIYAMIHYAASKHEGHAITIAFFDDRMDIHAVISKIFSAHRDLIPKNVTLECWHYHGTQLEKPVAVIEGTAVVIDHHFRENIKRIIEICGFSATEYEKAVDTGTTIVKDEAMSLLAAFKECRALSHPEQHELASRFQNALSLFAHTEPKRETVSAAAAAAAAATTDTQGAAATYSSLSSSPGV